MLLVLSQGASMIRLGTAFFLACRWPPPHCPYRQRENVWKHASCLLSLLIRALIHCEVPTHMTSSKPNYLSKATSPNTFTLGVRDPTHESVGEGRHNSVHNNITASKGRARTHRLALEPVHLNYALLPPYMLRKPVLSFLHTNHIYLQQLNFYKC